MIISHPLKAIITDAPPSPSGALQEKWYLKLNDPTQPRALWLEWDLMTSKNRFKKTADVKAVFFAREPLKEVKKVAFKQSLDIQAFSRGAGDTIQMGACTLGESGTRGRIHSKGQTIEWELSFQSIRASTFNLVPESLSKLGLSKHLALTPYEDLLFSGKVILNGEVFEFNSARGMLGRSLAPKNWHSWVWGHCNLFKNEKGDPADFIFEGITMRSQLGPWILPQFSAFYFRYQGKDYAFNRLRQTLYIKSKTTLNGWTFQADSDDLSFRGHMSAEHKDFAGLTLEDTNGSLLYSAYSTLSQLKILAYRRGKLETTFDASGNAAFELVSRQKNPYVPLII
jgi:hypothetical protein